MSKRNDTWMPLYIGDYLADTSRLSTEQHGAYLLILMDYWRNGPPIDDDKELASITKLPLAQWRKHAAKLRGFFSVEAGRLVQKRADEERGKAGLVSSKRSQAGKAGAASRWGKRDGPANSDVIANAMANAWQNDAPSPSQSNTPPTEAYHHPAGGQAHAGVDVVGAAQPTEAGAICRAMRQAGIADTNPGHPRLLSLLQAGATEAEFVGFAPAAIAKGAGFAWILGAVEGERTRAASAAATLQRGPIPSKADARVAANIATAQRFLERTAK